MSDLISRQAAITEFSCCELTPDGGIDVNYAIDFLEQLPSAQPERKTGRWIVVDGQVVCSECYNANAETDWCPHCGCKMEVEHEAD